LVGLGILCVGAVATATEYAPDYSGVWINVDTIDLSAYGEDAYMEFLGKGYVALLAKVKAEGLILDYGVMQKTTGNVGDGDVVIWWSTKTLGDHEKVYERFETLSGEMFSGEEWAGVWEKMDKIRTIRSTNIYREIRFEEVSEE
jgi:hypothetical protein